MYLRVPTNGTIGTCIIKLVLHVVTKLESFAEKLEKIIHRDQKFNAIRDHSMTTLIPHQYRIQVNRMGFFYNNRNTVMFYPVQNLNLTVPRVP